MTNTIGDDVYILFVLVTKINEEDERKQKLNYHKQYHQQIIQLSTFYP